MVWAVLPGDSITTDGGVVVIDSGSVVVDVGAARSGGGAVSVCDVTGLAGSGSSRLVGLGLIVLGGWPSRARRGSSAEAEPPFSGGIPESTSPWGGMGSEGLPPSPKLSAGPIKSGPAMVGSKLPTSTCLSTSTISKVPMSKSSCPEGVGEDGRDDVDAIVKK